MLKRIQLKRIFKIKKKKFKGRQHSMLLIELLSLAAETKKYAWIKRIKKKKIIVKIVFFLTSTFQPTFCFGTVIFCCHVKMYFHICLLIGKYIDVLKKKINFIKPQTKIYKLFLVIVYLIPFLNKCVL